MMARKAALIAVLLTAGLASAPAASAQSCRYSQLHVSSDLPAPPPTGNLQAHRASCNVAIELARKVQAYESRHGWATPTTLIAGGRTWRVRAWTVSDSNIAENPFQRVRATSRSARITFEQGSYSESDWHAGRV
jgi:hypothetical protein